MISAMLQSNGMYLIVFILCIIGGYHLMKLRHKARQREKAEKVLQEKQAKTMKEVNVYEVDEDEEEFD